MCGHFSTATLRGSKKHSSCGLVWSRSVFCFFGWSGWTMQKSLVLWIIGLGKQQIIGLFASTYPRFGGLPRWHSGKESTCQWRRCRFNPWVWKIPCSRKWKPTPVFLPGKLHVQRSLANTVHRATKRWTWLSNWQYTEYTHTHTHV